MMESKFVDSLRDEVKDTTLRFWQRGFLASHVNCFVKTQLVTVWQGQGHHSTCGFVLYTSMTNTTVGDVTEQDLVREGCGDMSLIDFKHAHLRHKLQSGKIAREHDDGACLVRIRFQYWPGLRLTMVWQALSSTYHHHQRKGKRSDRCLFTPGLPRKVVDIILQYYFDRNYVKENKLPYNTPDEGNLLFVAEL